jgi:hypothetical protein
MAYRAAAHQQPIVALGKAVKRQTLVMGFSDAFAVIGVVLVLAAIAVARTRKVRGSGPRSALRSILGAGSAIMHRTAGSSLMLVRSDPIW